MSRWLGIAAIVLAAAAVVAYKEAARPRAADAGAAAAAGPRTSAVRGATVPFFADPREAGTRCA